MTNTQSAEELMAKARFILENDLTVAHEKRNYSLCIRRAQEVVELSIKGFIKYAGGEYPKVHDPADVFVDLVRKYMPDTEDGTLTRIQTISASLAQHRAAAFYAERSYSSAEADRAVADARFVFIFIERAIKRK